MGVPGLWRILNLASQPLDLEKCGNLRIAIDVHSHLNRLVHGQNASNWLFTFMKDLFNIMNFNIRIVVVFMGKRPLEKIYSTALGDESTEMAYYRARSALLRTTKESPDRKIPPPKPITDEKIVLPQSPKIHRKKITSGLKETDDVWDVSNKQIETMGKIKPISPNHVVHHPIISNPFILDEKPAAQKVIDEINEPNKNIEITKPKEQNTESFQSELLEDIADIIVADDPSSELSSLSQPDNAQEEQINLDPLYLLPADNPYLAPIENYVTANHVRLVEGLCRALGIPFIHAPEEACAECARLENEGIVDATASDDNNSFLFGSRWLIRGVFTKPQSITIETLEKVGITRNRMINLAMMIDGDYNADIRKRLFTVGPVRGMEIISLFPDEHTGLFSFREWWIRVVKGQGNEPNSDLKHFSKKKWPRKLVMPIGFPPENLLNAFLKPVVGDEKPKVKLPKFDENNLIDFMKKHSAANEQRINDFVRAFKIRISTFPKTRTLVNYIVNEYKPNKTFEQFIDRLVKYEKEMKISSDEENDNEENIENETNDSELSVANDLTTEFLENSTSNDECLKPQKENSEHEQEEEDNSEEFSTASETDSIEN